MRFTRRLLAALCFLSIGAAGIASAEPVTDVVFGNLGTSGTGAITNTNTDVGPTAGFNIAQSFTIKQHPFCKSGFSEVGHLASMVR
jgi:hypothetical protein